MVDGPDQDSTSSGAKLTRRHLIGLVAAIALVLATNLPVEKSEKDNKSSKLIHGLYGGDVAGTLEVISDRDLIELFLDGFSSQVKDSEKLTFFENVPVDSVHIKIEPSISDGSDFVRDYYYRLERDESGEIINFSWENRYTFIGDEEIFSGGIFYENGELSFDDDFMENWEILTFLVNGTNELEWDILFAISQQLKNDLLQEESA